MTPNRGFTVGVKEDKFPLSKEQFKEYLSNHKIDLPTITPIGNGLIEFKSKDVYFITGEKAFQESIQKEAKRIITNK